MKGREDWRLLEATEKIVKFNRKPIGNVKESGIKLFSLKKEEEKTGFWVEAG